MPKSAEMAKELLEGFGLDDVHDVSAGAATFYVWVSDRWDAIQFYLKFIMKTS